MSRAGSRGFGGRNADWGWLRRRPKVLKVLELNLLTRHGDCGWWRRSKVEGLVLKLLTSSMSLLIYKLVDRSRGGEVGGKLLLLDLQLLLLLHLHQLLVLILGHNCRRWERDHGDRIIDPEAVRN